MENNDDPDVKKFQQLLQQYDLTQHIDSTTHISGGILDLVLTRHCDKNSLKIDNIQITQTVTTSDHFLLTFSCMFSHHLKSDQVLASGRKINDIDLESFKTDILDSELSNASSFKDCNTATIIIIDCFSKNLRTSMVCQAMYSAGLNHTCQVDLFLSLSESIVPTSAF